MNTQDSSRPEAAFILMLLQASFWGMAGLSAFPFVLAGEVYMLALGASSLGLAGLALVLMVGLVRRNRQSRRWAMALESVCLAGGLLQIALPLGANRGPVALMVNLGLPLAILLLLRGKRMRGHFGISAAGPG
jgi:hypothetical protein